VTRVTVNRAGNLDLRLKKLLGLLGSPALSIVPE
jgi:hypothetical protein